MINGIYDKQAYTIINYENVKVDSSEHFDELWFQEEPAEMHPIAVVFDRRMSNDTITHKAKVLRNLMKRYKNRNYHAKLLEDVESFKDIEKIGKCWWRGVDIKRYAWRPLEFSSQRVALFSTEEQAYFYLQRNRHIYHHKNASISPILLGEIDPLLIKIR